MAIHAASYGTRIIALGLFLHVAVAAQIVEHRFDARTNVHVRLVAIDAQAAARIVDVVVMARDAVDLSVIGVRERERQQWS